MQGFNLDDDSQITPQIIHKLQINELPDNTMDQLNINIEKESDSDEETDSDEEIESNNASEDLKNYYKSLDPDKIEEDIELMKVANVIELYQLISSNCKHYVSIIENYKKENLQSLFNMIVRRIEGHLLIKYKLNSNDRWIEVGFFDNENTDKETMDELKNSIAYCLKNYDEISQNRRKHIAEQFNKNDTIDSTTKSFTKKAIPDDHFDPKNNPELKVTNEQLKSAGYKQLPEILKEKEKQIRTCSSQTLDLNNHLENEPLLKKDPAVETDKIESPNIELNDYLSEFKRNLTTQLKKTIGSQPIDDNGPLKQISALNPLVDDSVKGDFNNLLINIENHHRTTKLIKAMNDQLHILPIEYHAYIYAFLLELTYKQSACSRLASYLTILNQNKSQPNKLFDSLTENQKKIVRQYDIDLSKLL